MRRDQVGGEAGWLGKQSGGQPRQMCPEQEWSLWSPGTFLTRQRGSDLVKKKWESQMQEAGCCALPLESRETEPGALQLQPHMGLLGGEEGTKFPNFAGFGH